MVLLLGCPFSLLGGTETYSNVPPHFVLSGLAISLITPEEG